MYNVKVQERGKRLWQWRLPDLAEVKRSLEDARHERPWGGEAMASETRPVGGKAAWDMLVGEDGAGRWARPFVRYWGFFFVALVLLVIWLPGGAMAARSPVLLWSVTYLVYSSSLEILSRRPEAKRLYENKLFHLSRIHFNLVMIAVLALISPPTASSYLWFFFSMPLLATIGYFGDLVSLGAIYLEVCAALLVLTLAQSGLAPLELATMLAKDAILGLLAAVLYFFVHLSPRVRETSTLLKAATTLIKVLDRGEIAQLIADAAKAGVPTADAVVVHLMGGENKQTLVPAAASNLDLATLGRSPMELGKGIAGHAIQSREAKNVPDVNRGDHSPLFHPSSREFKSLLVAPMYVGQKNVGSISVHSVKKNAFSQRDERFLRTLAAQGATAIANASSYKKLIEERNLLHTLINNLPDYIYAKDIEGRFVIANVAVARQMGVSSPDEVIGKSDFELFPNELAEQYYVDEQKIIQSGQGLYNHEGPTIDASKEDEKVWVSTTKVPLRDTQGEITGFVGLGRDITDRKRSEDALKRRAAQLTLLSEIGGQIATVLDLDSLLDRAVRLVQESFDYYHVALFTLDRKRNELVMRAKDGSFADLFPSDHRLKLDQGMVGWVGFHGETALANNVEAEPRYINRYPDLIPTLSELSVPIQVGEEVVGVLDVQSPQPNAFDDSDVMILEILADQIAAAIENARLYKEADRRENRLREYLSTVTNSLAHYTSLEGLYKFIVEAGTKFLSARDCSLFLTNGGNGSSMKLVVTAASSLWANKTHTATNFGPECRLVDHVVDWCQPVRLLGKEMLQHTLWNRELWRESEWAFDPETDHSVLAVPMCMPDGRIVGALVARTAESDEGFSEFDEVLLGTLATNAAADIERVRSIEEARVAERKRLETNLHDAMNILATGVRWEAEILAEEIARNDLEAATETLKRLQAARTRASTDLRYLLQDLRDPTLEHEGLVAALKKRAELIGHGRVVVESGSQERLPLEIESVLYRVGQETMDNAVKHSGIVSNLNTKIEVNLEHNSEQVEFCVRDDGEGFDVESILALSYKWGLRRLRDMVREVGGELHIDSAPGKGTTICATIDLTRGSYGQ